MGHVVNPLSLRLGLNRTWNSTWASHDSVNYTYLVQNDLFLHNFLKLFFNNSTFITNKFLYSHTKIVQLPEGRFNVINYIYTPVLSNKLETLFFLFNRILELTPTLRSESGKNSTSGNRSVFQDSLKESLVKGESNLEQLILSNNVIGDSLSNKNRDALVEEVVKSLYKFVAYHLYTEYYGKPLFYCLKLLNLIIKRWLCMVSPRFHVYDISYVLLKDSQVTPSVISYYIVKKLKQRNMLFKVLKPIFKNLELNPMIAGYKVSCSGRFTRKQRATYYWTNKGLVSFNKFNAVVDYSYRQVSLQFGVCGVKVWLCRNI